MANYNLICRLLLCVAALLPLAAAHGAQTPVQQLEGFLAQTRTMTADFRQVLLNEQGNPAQTSHGVFFLQRPGKFRWDYQRPFQQQIIATADKVLFYDHDLEQATVKRLDESVGTTPALLLSGDVPLARNYHIERQGDDGGLQWIKLVPKNADSAFRHVLIGLEQGALVGMELSDNFGQLTRIYFSNVRLNTEIPAAVFEFKPPEGTDVFSE